MKSSKSSFKGKLDIPNISDENTADEVDVSVTMTSTDDEAYKVKDFMRIQGQEKIREQIGKYIQQLREEFSQGMILPAKDGQKSSEKPAPSENQAKKEINRPILNAVKNQKLGVKIKCKKLTDKTEFKCRASELYRAFTDQGMVCAFTQGECQLEPIKGGKFAMFGDNITGEFTELEMDRQIQMRWRFKSWPAEHYSNVTLTLKEKDDCTSLELTQTGVPDTDYERTKEGWERYYWQAIKNTFGFGANLF